MLVDLFKAANVSCVGEYHSVLYACAEASSDKTAHALESKNHTITGLIGSIEHGLHRCRNDDGRVVVTYDMWKLGASLEDYEYAHELGRS